MMNVENYAIVTDSTADIPPDLVQQYAIYVIPNIMVINGQSMKDGEDISREEFYERLPEMKSPPTTATASPGVYQQLYAKLFQQGVKEILSIHASSLLSGIINAASTAASLFAGKVHVVDSEQVTLGLGFQVLAAAEAIRRGLSLDSILSLLQDVRRRVRVVALLDTLEYVRRSGRVSWARARLGELLQIKPIVEVKNGLVNSLGEVRSRHKGLELLKRMIQNLGALEKLAILHTNAETDARQILDSLHVELPTQPLIVNITTIIGAHVGPNGLGFAAVLRG